MTLEQKVSREKDWTQAKSNLVGTGHWLLPTHKLAPTSRLCPDNFIRIGPFVQKIFNIFQNVDAHTDTHTNYSPL